MSYHEEIVQKKEKCFNCWWPFHKSITIYLNKEEKWKKKFTKIVEACKVVLLIARRIIVPFCLHVSFKFGWQIDIHPTPRRRNKKQLAEVEKAKNFWILRLKNKLPPLEMIWRVTRNWNYESWIIKLILYRREMKKNKYQLMKCTLKSI